jgi:hypothetical protein
MARGRKRGRVGGRCSSCDACSCSPFLCLDLSRTSAPPPRRRRILSSFLASDHKPPAANDRSACRPERRRLWRRPYRTPHHGGNQLPPGITTFLCSEAILAGAPGRADASDRRARPAPTGNAAGDRGRTEQRIPALRGRLFRSPAPRHDRHRHAASFCFSFCRMVARFATASASAGRALNGRA